MLHSFKELVSKYWHNTSLEDMECLADKVDWFVEEVRKKDPELTDKFLIKIDLLLNPHFTEETAKYVVSKMLNKDGSVGEHWTYDQTSSVMKTEGFDFDEADWYYTLNMIYSDYYKNGRTTETYVELAHDFLADSDAPEGKAKKYFWAMHE